VLVEVIRIHTIKPTNALMLKFFDFRSIMFILGELLNINIAYVKTYMDY